ncbi:diacylglycerol kinase 5-like [Prunus yedoensis var. nudiflora]|uniref:Diacylglycerol kinase 5-like n=1 Tax=Prunus yedoensis var. nudiflora TaxID=2094558 RepID=A0A314ZEJ5_PRUYE|nr:diacylglycerol kinase 5-like [Prunus yedoensis var. nudiflora]
MAKITTLFIYTIILLIISLKEDPPLYMGSIHIGEVTPKNPSFIGDGRLEVMGGFEGRYGRPLRDQVRGIRFEFIEGATKFVSINFDGAPWTLDSPTNNLVDIEISYHGQVNILAGPNCAAQSIHHSAQSSVSQADAKD